MAIFYRAVGIDIFADEETRINSPLFVFKMRSQSVAQVRTEPDSFPSVYVELFTMAYILVF